MNCQHNLNAALVINSQYIYHIVKEMKHQCNFKIRNVMKTPELFKTLMEVTVKNKCSWLVNYLFNNIFDNILKEQELNSEFEETKG